ncbi:two-component system OmpR family response regulator [Erysipelotrichaceae bacterium]|nr:two-component system OmpR family response regulator [Erysipelotrichaceae bacterium]
MPKILIIEDDTEIAELQQDYLKMNGFSVQIEKNGQKGYELAKSNTFKLIILDVMLPNMDGYTICRKLRAEGIITPILLVTAKHDDIDKIRGLGLGADDFITKPFSPSELVARVKAHINRFSRLVESKNTHDPTTIITLGSIIIDAREHQVKVGESTVILKNKEFELLLYFMKNPQIVFSKEHLFDKIWGQESFGDLATIAVHINRLRDKIEKDSKNPEYIETVWGVGYRFIGK